MHSNRCYQFYITISRIFSRVFIWTMKVNRLTIPIATDTNQFNDRLLPKLIP